MLLSLLSDVVCDESCCLLPVACCCRCCWICCCCVLLLVECWLSIFVVVVVICWSLRVWRLVLFGELLVRCLVLVYLLDIACCYLL